MKKNLFWTGGFDSTFRLLQLVNDSEVVEINLFYIGTLIDNIKRMDSLFLDARRHSFEKELMTMSKILSTIDTTKIKKFTIWSNNDRLLLCTMIFPYDFMNYINREEINYSNDVKINQFDLWINGFILRPVTQYGAISQLLHELEVDAEIGIEKEGGIWTRTNKFFKEKKEHNKIQFNFFPGKAAFDRYELPLYDVSRKDMIEIAKKNDWMRILFMTWSCWYPQDNIPCGKCDMCRDREGLFDFD